MAVGEMESRSQDVAPSAGSFDFLDPPQASSPTRPSHSPLGPPQRAFVAHARTGSSSSGVSVTSAASNYAQSGPPSGHDLHRPTTPTRLAAHRASTAFYATSPGFSSKNLTQNHPGEGAWPPRAQFPADVVHSPEWRQRSAGSVSSIGSISGLPIPHPKHDGKPKSRRGSNLSAYEPSSPPFRNGADAMNNAGSFQLPPRSQNWQQSGSQQSSPQQRALRKPNWESFLPSGQPVPSPDLTPEAGFTHHTHQPRSQPYSKTKSPEKTVVADAPTPTSSKPNLKLCGKCDLAISGQFVRALGGAYHLECFTCDDCSKPCASKFFPMDKDSRGKATAQYPLCENCYFKRLDLLCYRCGEALRGSYITALDRKYHVEHFTCTACTTVFGPEDSYYEHGEDVYCHFHYWMMYAARCEGCQTAILKQFVETYRGGKEQQWHPECYMIFKFWNVKLASDLPPPLSLPSTGDSNDSSENELSRSPASRSEPLSSGDGAASNASTSAGPTPTSRNSSVDAFSLTPGHEVTQEKRQAVLRREKYIDGLVLSIWTTLCGFEEVTAASISSMLQCAVSNDFNMALEATSKLVSYVQVLFNAIDSIPASPQVSRLGKEPKTLCRKIVSYMSLVSKTRQAKETVSTKQSQDLLGVASSLAHYLKVLIRYGLASSLTIDRGISGNTSSEMLSDHPTLKHFLDAIVEYKRPPSHVSVSALTSDKCVYCDSAVEEKCIRCRDKLWHIDCFKCTSCKKALSENFEDAVLSESKITCRECYDSVHSDTSPEKNKKTETDFLEISRLKQYVFLLYVAVARLELVLGQQDARDNTKSGSVSTPALPRPSLGEPEPSGRRGSSDNMNQKSYLPSLADARRTRKAKVDAKIGPAASAGTSETAPAAALQRTSDMLHSKAALTLDDIRRIVAAEQAREQMPNAFRHQKGVDDMLSVPQTMASGDKTLLSYGDLSNEDYKLVQQIGSVFLTNLVCPKYLSESEMNEIFDSKQPSLWEKMGKAFGGGGQRKRSGVFGVPLEVLIEKNGVDSSLGVGDYTVRIPSFVDDCLSSMRQKDMSIEGIFRKNGNIRRLKEFVEMVDKSPDTNVLSEESVIQLAALLKKFLREMPIPLMGAKLGRVWVLVTRVPAEQRVLLVRYLVSVLARPYRDLLEVLVYFLNWVASFAHLDDEAGSKMDAHNLATVITPNIFPSGSEGEPDTYLQAIEAVSLLIEQHILVSHVPQNIQDVMAQVKAKQQGKDKVNNKEINELVRNKATMPGASP